jgi:dTMP kinase
MESKGLLITLEGGEGAGKSTLLDYLFYQLAQTNHPVIKTREPGGSELGEAIRRLLLQPGLSPIGPKAELLLFLAARAQHIEEVIRPALNTGHIVLCDRFNDSTIAYQGAARGLDFAEIQQFCDLVCREIQPKLTLLLDLPPEEGFKRIRNLFKQETVVGDRFEAEQLDFHARVRQAFLDLAEQYPERIHLIDASQPKEAVQQEAWRIIELSLL